MIEIVQTLSIAREFAKPNARRLAMMEGPTNCNRSCEYCTVPQRWDVEKSSTLEQTYRQIDWLHDQGFRILSYVGGEPFAPYRTKEGLTFAEHTESVVRYAAREKGMLVYVTTNGDYINPYVLKKIKSAGLDALALSLHSLTEQGIEHILEGAKMAAQEKIIPTVSVVFTNDRTSIIPNLAAKCAENGVLFSTTVVQEYGGGFSAVPEVSKIPTVEQQKEVFKRLMELKKAGFVRINRKYLEYATNFPQNSWKCDHQKDNFIHIRAEGEGMVDVCSEVQTDFLIPDVSLDDTAWREAKRNLVHNCNNCLYNCTYESENPDLKGDIPTFLIMALIKSGQAKLVEKLGKRAAKKFLESC